MLLNTEGQPTRWGRWSPEYLNENRDWSDGRGVNSLEILQCFSMKYEDGGPEKGLSEFKQWVQSFDPAECIDDICKERFQRRNSKRKNQSNF